MNRKQQQKNKQRKTEKTNRKTDDRKDLQLELSDEVSKITKLKAISVIRGMLRTSAENWNNKKSQMEILQLKNKMIY